jgi:hypothetical protein
MADPAEGRRTEATAASGEAGRPPARHPLPSDQLIRRRSWLEIRWRQFRNPPRPVFRAVASSGGVAIVVGLAYLAYDVAIARGAVLPGGDLRSAAVVGFVAIVLASGSLLTYLLVPLPIGAGGRIVRSGWNAALGLLAALPIAYLVLVIESQVIKPLLV